MLQFDIKETYSPDDADASIPAAISSQHAIATARRILKKTVEKSE